MGYSQLGVAFPAVNRGAVFPRDVGYDVAVAVAKDGTTLFNSSVLVHLE